MTGDANALGAQVVDAAERQRYEIVSGGGVVLGHAAYRRDGEAVVITHTEVDRALAGRGLGGRLVHGVLEDLRYRGLQVRPACPFVRAWIARHPAYADLVDGREAEGTHDMKSHHVRD